MYVRSKPSYPVMAMLTEGDRSVNELLMMLENLKKFLLVYPVVLNIRNAASLPSLYILILSCKKKGITVKSFKFVGIIFRRWPDVFCEVFFLQVREHVIL